MATLFNDFRQQIAECKSAREFIDLSLEMDDACLTPDERWVLEQEFGQAFNALRLAEVEKVETGKAES